MMMIHLKYQSRKPLLRRKLIRTSQEQLRYPVDRASTKTVTVSYTVAVGTATAADFTLADATIIFRPDPSTKITPTSLNIT